MKRTKPKRYRPIKRWRKHGSICRCHGGWRPVLTTVERDEIYHRCGDLLFPRLLVT